MKYVTVPLAGFNRDLATVLPRLIAFITSPVLREHPLWKNVVPYHVPLYGTGTSLGHCIRPDVILGADAQPYVCELDFVPSGRGYLLASLYGDDQKEMLETFASWYRSLEVKDILYATASTTVCYKETQLFSDLLRETCGVSIREGNVDLVREKELRNIFIDRLFYRSEMKTPRNLAGIDVATAEPWLDSKIVFAVVHDQSLTKELESVLGEEGLVFLRRAFPYSVLMATLSEKEIRTIAHAHTDWVIKNGDVELTHSWGCRGTFIGASYTRKKFLEIMQGVVTARGKDMGHNPILQRFYPSQNFTTAWNGVVDGVYRASTLTHEGCIPDEKTGARATKSVGARVGFYFLVNRMTHTCTVTPAGILTLRQDHLVHGTPDALMLAVKAT